MSFEVAPLISVIVPFYNAKKCLSIVVSSLQKQDDLHFELLLVDDGSTDGSSELAQVFAASDRRIHFFQKSNGGVSSARNLGLTMAKGDWVLFVDADDSVEPDFVSSMRAAALGHDLAICAYDSVGADVSLPFVFHLNGAGITMDQVYEHSLCTPILNGGCCNKVFRLDLIRQHALQFDERLSVGEDMVFLAQYYRHCHSADYINRVLYHYTVNHQSLTQSALTHGFVTERDTSVLRAMDALQQALLEQKPNIRAYGRFRQVRSSLRLLFQMVLAGSHSPTGLGPLTRLVRGGLWHFLRSPHARWVERLTALGFALLPKAVFTMAVSFASGRARWVSGLRG